MARTSDVVSASLPVSDEARRVDALPPGVLVARVGAGANCSSAGSAIDILFYTSVIAGAIAVALSAAFPPRAVEPPGGESGPPPEPPSGDDPAEEMR
jgi:hypothetical protein